MKKIFLHILFLLSIVGACIDRAAAQSYYPADSVKIFRRDSVAYVSSDGPFLKLYNIHNTLTNVKQRYKNGDEIPLSIEQKGLPRPWIDSYGVVMIFHNLINMAFTAEDKQNAADGLMVAMIYIDSDTGLVREVEFSFNIESYAFSRVPPESYYRLEQKIRKYMKVEMTDFGRQYNYNLITMPYKGVFFGQEPLNPELYP